MTGSPEPVRWVSFTDEDDKTWLFDLTFLTSSWTCTFGTTCKGTEPGDNGARGCCAHGAHLVDRAERDRIIGYATRLTDEIWQNRAEVVADDDLFELVDGDPATRRVGDACIFLNSPDFDGGHGCALHIGAIEAGERPLDWKPTVCWQLPFRHEEYDDASGTQTVTLRAWRRSDWGEGGADFAWWCTEELEPGVPGAQTWELHIDELRELVGDGPLEWLVDHLRRERAETPVELG